MKYDVKRDWFVYPLVAVMLGAGFVAWYVNLTSPEMTQQKLVRIILGLALMLLGAYSIVTSGREMMNRSADQDEVTSPLLSSQ
jgi:hypothetical protein